MTLARRRQWLLALLLVAVATIGLAAPAGAHAELITLEPTAAASKILDQLRAWGYLDAATSKSTESLTAQVYSMSPSGCGTCATSR